MLCCGVWLAVYLPVLHLSPEHKHCPCWKICQCARAGAGAGPPPTANRNFCEQKISVAKLLRSRAGRAGAGQLPAANRHVSFAFSTAISVAKRFCSRAGAGAGQLPAHPGQPGRGGPARLRPPAPRRRPPLERRRGTPPPPPAPRPPLRNKNFYGFTTPTRHPAPAPRPPIPRAPCGLLAPLTRGQMCRGDFDQLLKFCGQTGQPPTQPAAGVLL